jgi:ABC-2 type transport system permease protein
VLWYKTWLETRVRFVICLVGMTVLCWYPVHDDIHWAQPETTLRYYYASVHSGHGMLGALWLVAVIFLVMGGLLREKAVGAAAFTLALPFSRARLMGVRIATGMMEAIVLILVPSAAICMEADMFGKPYPMPQVWFHLVLLISGGMVPFVIALLIASLVEGEYTAPLVSFGVLIGAIYLLGDQEVQKFNPYRFMAGTDYFDRTTGLLVGPIPWTKAGVFLLLAALLSVASVKAIEMRDF